MPGWQDVAVIVGGSAGALIGALFVAAAGLTGAAGVVLLLGLKAGLFVLIPAFIASLIGGAANAWLLLTRIAR